MVNFDSDFEAASIATTRAVFAAELGTGFSNWRKLPSGETRACVEAWVKMGSRAALAHDQQLAHYYRTCGYESLLPASLRAIQTYTEFEEWKAISIQTSMSGFSYFVEDVRTSTHKADAGWSKRTLEDAVRRNGIGFESDSTPLFFTKSGCAVYLQVMQRRRFVDVQMLCCLKGDAPVLANHRGLHGIITECKADMLTISSDALETVVNEIVRHVGLMRENMRPA